MALQHRRKNRNRFLQCRMHGLAMPKRWQGQVNVSFRRMK
ncbi:hypothetical protein Agau_C101610 [Agrobacterium tumefaciens F2]|nr:hypothetical protein Agau_C101610 [Agrobacterium tumefaciens F2]